MIADEKVLKKMSHVSDILISDFPPKTPLRAPQDIIDFTKASMLPLCFILQILFQNFSTRACLYTAVHGTYGLIWLMKSRLYFPDPGFSKKVTLGSNINILVALIHYYLLPLTCIISKYDHDIKNGNLMVVLFSFVIGVFFMVGSDAQKFYTLKYKKGLISEGFFRKTRNPNYFGEYLIYLSFVMMTESTKLFITISL